MSRRSPPGPPGSRDPRAHDAIRDLPRLGRRTFLAGVGGSIALGPLAGCATAPKRPPLAHLYGDQWVQGAYGLYAKEYRGLTDDAQQASFTAYGTLARRGADALTGLQTREVPFSIRVQAGDRSFRVERDLPERLTFDASMTADDRARAQAAFAKAREHLHTDYEEIRKLDDSLTTLLAQVQRVRRAIDEGDREEFRLVRQIVQLRAGQEPPFPLPYQVSRERYLDVLHLLLERLDDDTRRLASLEASMVTVGLVARATDRLSGSRAENLHRVLLAVDEDAAASEPRSVDYPGDETRRRAALERGRALVDEISKDPVYLQWEKRERTSELDRLGALIAVLDAATGLPVSSVYRQAIEIWRGEADYLSYLRTVARFLPGGSVIERTLVEAIAITEKARRVVGTVDAALSGELLTAELQKRGAGLVNTASAFGRDRLSKQLVFFDQAEQATRARAEVLASFAGAR
jgi:hypothetical protein